MKKKEQSETKHYIYRDIGMVKGYKLENETLESDALIVNHIRIEINLSSGVGAEFYETIKDKFRPENLKPVFKMLTDWLPRLRQYAKHFVGIDDGIMLPHAVDDRGTCMGGFWTGCIDHACAAWMVQMMYDYCDYFNDEAYLRETVFDFMKGVMRVFEEMITRKEDGSLELTVSSSPEYRGCAMDAWGANSSFQLAAIHRLAENLIAAARILNEKCDPFWQEVLEKLRKMG